MVYLRRANVVLFGFGQGGPAHTQNSDEWRSAAAKAGRDAGWAIAVAGQRGLGDEAAV